MNKKLLRDINTPREKLEEFYLQTIKPIKCNGCGDRIKHEPLMGNPIHIKCGGSLTYDDNNTIPLMKMNPVFVPAIKYKTKTKEFRKSRKFNQTGWVAVVNMNTMNFLFFIFITPEAINPIIKEDMDGIEMNGRRTFYAYKDYQHYYDFLRPVEISQEEYDFTTKRYVDKHDFIMFNIDKVVE